MTPQRLRITYRKTGALQWVAHLDMMRTWERALRRARLPLAYSQGFSPHSRLSLGAPLSVGAVGERELLDVWLEEAVATEVVARALGEVLPDGLAVVAVEAIGERTPAIQAATQAARYRVTLDRSQVDVDGLRSRIAELLARDALEWEEQRGEKTRRYDLRAAVYDIALSVEDEAVTLEMHLALNEHATGRPQAVLAALGVEAQPLAIVRTAIELESRQVAMRGAVEW